MKKELAKQYNPREVEDRLYAFWLKGEYFKAKADKNLPTYTIVIPPPNITGQLHMGHALDETLQDILIRWRRMQGYDTLWLPGTDHASIATEVKIVEKMKEEGLSKEDVGREGFLERAWKWKEQYGGIIIEQLKKLGSSCDWSRERFTLDEGCNRAVNTVFVNLYKEGLIYRGERMINWCPDCLTSISDAEVEHEEKGGHFWHIKYPVKNSDRYIVIATTRPETMLGDTAVAVHPDDERYKDLIGKTLILPLVGREIPIIADTYVDMEFGTGAVKITPAHDPNDFEVGLRHNLPVIDVMTDDGKMSKLAGEKYAGLDRFECRKLVVKDLEEIGALLKTEDITHSVGTCYRCSTVVEPRISMQWFVKMEPLAKPAIEAVKKGDIRFVPERFEKIYFHWMENIKDWCISRQLWWGHRIPAWYCDDCGHITVAVETPDKCEKCGSAKIHQDEDTLDTWFSSALWPFSTLGWPDKTFDYEHFYPTNTLVTAYDIIFFWVARMIFSGLHHTGKAPFNTVFIHGLVRDELGRKMSKSLGNGVDPLKIIEDYGADALRFSLATGNSPGNDMRFSEKKVEASRNFSNKLWNAARFVLMNLSDDEPAPHIPDELNLEDKWIISRYNTVLKEVTESLEKFEIGIAVQKLYDFIWDEFCDWYIELSKIRLQKEGKEKENAKAVLVFVLSETLKLLHPFMPFITEEIWQTLPHEGETIMLSPWRKFDESLSFPEAETEIQRIMEAIRAIRNRRAEMNVHPSKKANLFIKTAYKDTFSYADEFFKKLAGASEVTLVDDYDIEGAVSVVTTDAAIYIPMSELVDFEAERKRLEKELKATEEKLAQIEAKLSNEGFLAKAPEHVINAQKEAAAGLKEKIAMLKEDLSKLG
ncbi:MAG TPA: valine--tRNA ligase [Clostridiales bacterium]|nr:valine--tRNA ligase [Clostridiales bacterium]